MTALAVAWNERTYDVTFIKEMRKALDAAGLAHVKTIAPDAWGHMWAIVADMQKDKDLTAAIDVLGTHQECYGSATQMPPPGTMALGKPLWSTELHIGEIGSYAGCDAASTKASMDLPAWDIRAGLHLARALNRGYLIANMTSTLIWTPIYSWYEYLLCEHRSGPSPRFLPSDADRCCQQTAAKASSSRTPLGPAGTAFPTRSGWSRTRRSSCSLAGGSLTAGPASSWRTDPGRLCRTSHPQERICPS